VSVSAIPDECAISLRLVFPDNVCVRLDTQELMELRASVEGFDTHLMEVRVDGEARTLTYDMLHTDVECESARARGVFYSPHVTHTRDIGDFVALDQTINMGGGIPTDHADCVLEVCA
jgi:hypothetical protein